MSIKLQVAKGLGDAYLNCLRAISYVGHETVRPIGFKFDGCENIINIANNVQEDTPTVISNVSKGIFKCNGLDFGVKEVQCVCDGVLTLQELLEGSGIISLHDCEIIHSTSPINVSVVFAKAAGWYTVEMNTSKLKENGFNNYIAINSRHCDIETFSYNRVSRLDDVDVYEVNIVTNGSISEQAVLDNSMKILSNAEQDFVKIIS